MSIQNKITSLIFMAVSLIYLLPSSALAQKLDSNAVVAADAYHFAKDVAGVSSDNKTFKALEDAYNKQQGKENASGISAGSYVQCGNTPCNLETHTCFSKYREGSIAFNQFEYKCVSKSSSEYQNYVTARDWTEEAGGESYVGVGQKGTMDMIGADGNKYQVVISGDTMSVMYANEGKKNAAIRGCEVLPVKLYNYKKCFFCPLVGVIYDGSAQITDIAFAKMAAAFATLLIIGFAIWIALQVLSQVSSITKQDAPKFLASLIKQSYKVIIAFFLLQFSGQIFEYVINPVLETGLTFGKNMLNTTDVFDGINYNDEGMYERQATSVTGGQHYTTATYDKLEEFIVSVQQEIAFMQAVGTSLVCTGSNLMLLKEGIRQFGDGFQMFIQGATLAIFGFLLSLAFVFYLIDAIVQMGVVGALLPFLIAAWPFKATSKYTGTGVQMLLNSAFLFLFVGFVVSVNIVLIDQALSQTAEGTDETLGALSAIAQALNSQDPMKLKELTDISAIGFLILLFCCLFGFKFTNQAGALADKFASGTISKPIAPSIATMGASFAKSAALKATEQVRESAGDKAERLVKWGVGLAPRGAKALWRRVRGKNKVKTSGNPSSQSAAEATIPTNDTSPADNNGRSGAALNERSGTPKTNNVRPKTSAQPTLNETSNGQRSKAPRYTEDVPQSFKPESQDDAPVTPTLSERQDEKPQSSEQNSQAENSQPQKNGQSSANNSSPRKPESAVNTPRNAAEPRPQGGSGHNRKKFFEDKFNEELNKQEILQNEEAELSLQAGEPVSQVEESQSPVQDETQTEER